MSTMSLARVSRKTKFVFLHISDDDVPVDVFTTRHARKRHCRHWQIVLGA